MNHDDLLDSIRRIAMLTFILSLLVWFVVIGVVLW